MSCRLVRALTLDLEKHSATVRSKAFCRCQNPLPAPEDGSPVEACSEAAGQEEIASIDSIFFEKFVERDRDGSGGCIAIAFEIFEDAVAVESHDIACGMDDPDVGLMRDEPANVVDGHSGISEHILRRVSQNSDSPLEDGPAVHGQVLEAVFDGFKRGRDPAAASGPVQEVAARSIGAELVGDHALIGRAGGQKDSACAVSKQGEAFLVAWVDDSAVAVATDDQSELAVACGDKLAGCDEGIGKPRTGGLDIKCWAGQAKLVLNLTGNRGGAHVGRKGAYDQEIDIIDITPDLLNGLPGGT